MAVFTLHHKKLSVSVNSLGAELCSLKKDQEELLWQANKKIWPRHAPVLFPIVGKLKNSCYNYNGKEYSLPQHGFARDKEFILTEQTDSVLEFELTASEESLTVYPFHFSLIIRYELLDNELNVQYRIFNPGSKNLLFSIGAHPGFSCKRIENETLEDLYLDFESGHELAAQKLKNGLITDETHKIKLQNGTLPLKSDLFENDALVFKNTQVNSVKLASKRSATVIKLVCKSWPYFGIWTKKDCKDFICLEPWYGVADDEQTKGNLEEKEGIIKVLPYASFKTDFSLEITG